MSRQWPHSIREPAFRADAARQTVSVTINSDLYAKAKAVGINVSRVAEEALVAELERHRRADVERDVRAGLAAIDAFEKQHGSFAEHMRTHFGDPWASEE